MLKRADVCWIVKCGDCWVLADLIKWGLRKELSLMALNLKAIRYVGQEED